MAKISARGCTTVLTARRTDAQLDGRTVEIVYVLRSDGAMLRRYTKRDAAGREMWRTGYTRRGNDRGNGTPFDSDTFRAFWSARGYSIA